MTGWPILDGRIQWQMFCCWSCLLINPPSTTQYHELGEHKPQVFLDIQVLIFLSSFLFLSLYLYHYHYLILVFFLRPSSPLLLRINKHHPSSSSVPCYQPSYKLPLHCHDGLLRRPLLRPRNVPASHQYLCCRHRSSRTMHRELYTMFTTRSHEQHCASTGRCPGRPLL